MEKPPKRKRIRPKVKCPDCDAELGGKDTLKRHMEPKHSGKKPFICPVPGCGKAFARSDELTTHMTKNHETHHLRFAQDRAAQNQATSAQGQQSHNSDLVEEDGIASSYGPSMPSTSSAIQSQQYPEHQVFWDPMAVKAGPMLEPGASASSNIPQAASFLPINLENSNVGEGGQPNAATAGSDIGAYIADAPITTAGYADVPSNGGIINPASHMSVGSQQTQAFDSNQPWLDSRNGGSQAMFQNSQDNQVLGLQPRAEATSVTEDFDWYIAMPAPSQTSQTAQEVHEPCRHPAQQSNLGNIPTWPVIGTPIDHGDGTTNSTWTCKYHGCGHNFTSFANNAAYRNHMLSAHQQAVPENVEWQPAHHGSNNRSHGWYGPAGMTQYPDPTTLNMMDNPHPDTEQHRDGGQKRKRAGNGGSIAQVGPEGRKKHKRSGTRRSQRHQENQSPGVFSALKQTAEKSPAQQGAAMEPKTSIDEQSAEKGTKTETETQKEIASMLNERNDPHRDTMGSSKSSTGVVEAVQDALVKLGIVKLYSDGVSQHPDNRAVRIRLAPTKRT